MPKALPSVLYTCEQTRQLDALAITQANIPGIQLMKRAGTAAFKTLLNVWPQVERLLVLCGSGNNGGDAYIVAALAAQRNVVVELYACSDADQLKGDAAKAKDFALSQGLEIRSLDDLSFAQNDHGFTVVVDGVLGTGFQGELRAPLRALFQKINAAALPLLALDIPSGLEGDTGHADRDALVATHTITFIGVKQGLLTGRGPALCGELRYDDLALPQNIYAQVRPAAACVARVNALPLRPRDAHKNTFGHVLVVGGDLGMGGAAMLTAEAAMRCGAGLVSVATRAEHVAPLLARLPEAMVRGVNGGMEAADMIEKADVIVVGPGLGRSAWSQQLLYFVLQSSQPKVIDADALNLLADQTLADFVTGNCVFTPHPGEAAHLLECDGQAIQRDRFASARALQSNLGGVVLLKGAGTVICDGVSTTVTPVGNAGMAVAGMGDVLSGVIAALMAHGLTPTEAAINGACAHGQAGDLAAESGLHGVRASDLMPHLRYVLNTGSEG